MRLSSLALLTLIGCSSPKVAVELDLPSAYVSLVSYVDLSVVNLGTDSQIVCDDLKWGRESSVDLAATSDDYHVTSGKAALTNIPRDGTKLFYAEARAADDRLVAVACASVGEVDRNLTVKLSAEPAAYLALPTGTETFEARLVGESMPDCHDLPQAYACQGTARDIQGNPIAGRDVVWHLTGADVDVDGGPVTSDTDGTFALPRDRPRHHGPYLLELRAAWQAESAEPLSSLFEPPPVTLGMDAIEAVTLGRFLRTAPQCPAAPLCAPRDLAVLGKPTGSAATTVVVYSVDGLTQNLPVAIDPALLGSVAAQDLVTLATREHSCPDTDSIVAIGPTTLTPSCPTDHQLLEVSQAAVAGELGVTVTPLPSGPCGRLRDLRHVRCADAEAGTLIATFDATDSGTGEMLDVEALTLDGTTPPAMQSLSTGEKAVSAAGCMGDVWTQSLEPVVLMGSDDGGAVLLSLTNVFAPVGWANLSAPADISARGRTTLPELFVPRAYFDHVSLSSHLLDTAGGPSAVTLVDRQLFPVLGEPRAVRAAHLDGDDLPDVVALFKVGGDLADAGLFVTLVALGRMRGDRHIAALSLPRRYVAPLLLVGDVDGDCYDDRVVADGGQAELTGEPSVIELYPSGESAP